MPMPDEGTPQCVFFGDCWTADWFVLATAITAMTPSKNKGHHADHNGTYSRRWRLCMGVTDLFSRYNLDLQAFLRDGGIDSQTCWRPAMRWRFGSSNWRNRLRKKRSINGR
jgi:hypothetical protein